MSHYDFHRSHNHWIHGQVWIDSSGHDIYYFQREDTSQPNSLDTIGIHSWCIQIQEQGPSYQRRDIHEGHPSDEHSQVLGETFGTAVLYSTERWTGFICYAYGQRGRPANETLEISSCSNFGWYSGQWCFVREICLLWDTGRSHQSSLWLPRLWVK